MTAISLLFTLSAIGISETIYLVRKRRAHEAPVCPIGEGCAVVLNSKYNKLFFISNDVLGFLAYILLCILSAFLVIEVEPLRFFNILFKIMVFSASLISVFFTYLQWKVLKTWCFWCLMSACTIWLMGIIILVSKSI